MFAVDERRRYGLAAMSLISNATGIAKARMTAERNDPVLAAVGQTYMAKPFRVSPQESALLTSDRTEGRI